MTSSQVDRVVENLQQVLASFDPEDASRAPHEAHLGNLLVDHVLAGDKSADSLDVAVGLHRAALSRTPRADGAYAARASDLSRAIAEAVQANRLPATTLLEAIDLQRDAVAVTSPDNPARAALTSNLGNRLSEGVRVGLLPPAALDEALRWNDEALKLTPGTDPSRAARASNLGTGLAEAVLAGVRPSEDLADAVHLLREAVTLAANRQEKALYNSNLAATIQTAVNAEALTVHTLPEAISLLEETLDLLPPDHLDRPSHLTNLGSVISDGVYAGVLQPDSLIRAVELEREALALVSESHPNRATHCSNLGNRLSEAASAGLLDLASHLEAVALLREAATRTSTHHPHRTRRLSNLGAALVEATHAGALDARSAALELLPVIDAFWDVARFGASNPMRRRRVVDSARGLVAGSVDVVLAGLGPVEAIRCVEALRNHLAAGWQAPAPPGAGAVPVSLIARYTSTSARYAASQRDFAAGLADVFETDKAQKELYTLVGHIRGIPGLRSFGTRPSIEDIAANLDSQTAAVYLLPGRTSGTALLLTSDGRIDTIPLPGLTVAATRQLAKKVLASSSHVQSVAAWLWQHVAKPLRAEESSHSEWVIIPTDQLALLPLHAAGTYDEGWLDDYNTVRTAPCLTRTRHEAAPTASGRSLVGMSDGDSLPFVAADLALARHLFPDWRQLAGQRSSRSDVLHALTNAPTAILSGHAEYSLLEGGGLAFPEGTLTSEQLQTLPVQDRHMAFLNACSSGQIALRSVEESVGLPNALLGVGFKSVCATMWPVRDLVAFIALSRFLSEMSKTSSAPSSVHLRSTRQWMREVTTGDLYAWLDELAQHLHLPSETNALWQEWLAPYGTAAKPLSDPADWATFMCIGD